MKVRARFSFNLKKILRGLCTWKTHLSASLGCVRKDAYTGGREILTGSKLTKRASLVAQVNARDIGDRGSIFRLGISP